MHKEPETLGEILKTARMRADITMETLAERVVILPSDTYIGLRTRERNPVLMSSINSSGNLQYQRIRFSIPKSRPKIPK